MATQMREPQVVLENKKDPHRRLRVVERGESGAYWFVVEAYDGDDALGVERWAPFHTKFRGHEGSTAIEQLLWLACGKLMRRRRRQRAQSKESAS